MAERVEDGRFFAGVNLIARRELRILVRGRSGRTGLILLLCIAWLPPILASAQAGRLGLASFVETVPYTLALAGVILPLLALLAGASLLADELEDGSLVPILTLPISRTACLVGKALGRGGLFAAAYLVAFASAAVVLRFTIGPEGARDYLAVALVGLPLCSACACIGAAIAAAGKGRVHAYGLALGAWLLLTIALDAALLTLVIALAPVAPTEVGSHGHGEIAAPMAGPMAHDPTTSPHQHHHPMMDAPVLDRPSGWLLLLDPVDLYRLTSMASAPGLRRRLDLPLPSNRPGVLWSLIGLGWILWTLLPASLALRRFSRLSLR